MKKIYSLLLLTLGLMSTNSVNAKEIKTNFRVSTDKEISVASSELDGQTFVASDAEGTNMLYTTSGSQDLKTEAISNFASTQYYRWKFAKVTDAADCGVEGDLYTIQLMNDDDAYISVYGQRGYINFQPSGNIIFALGLTGWSNANKYGQDFNYGGLWQVTKDDNGYLIYNVGKQMYLNPASAAPVADKAYVRLFSALSYDTESVAGFDFTEKTANTTTFDLTKATNYDLETGAFTEKGGWTFDEPVDLSAHKWLVVTTSYNASAGSKEIRISDANGTSFGGEDYNKGGGVSRANMWLDRWNNQVCAAISMEYLSDKGLDITKIASLTIGGARPVSAVYLTNYEAGQAVASIQSWGACTGDYVREYAHLGEGEYKFGTIALNYAAAVSGAQVFTVESFDGSTMVLARHYGVLKAETPYIYMANDEVGVDGSGASNVNFFRVDENGGTATGFTPDANGNGLVGCYNGFGYGTANLKNCYVLNNNKLHLIDTADNEVTVGSNKCFFDPKKCTSKSSDAKTITISTDDATAINNVTANKTLTAGKVYDMNGREAKSLKKGGMYIMNGVKILVK